MGASGPLTLRLPLSSKAVRRVRTPEGAARFDQPVGSVIVPKPRVTNARPFNAAELEALTPDVDDQQRARVRRYTGGGYWRVNKPLRAGRTPVVVESLDAMMRPTPRDAVVFRTTAPGDLGWEPGTTWTDLGYTSARARPRAADPSKLQVGGASVRLTIRVPAGTPAAYVAPLSRHPYEDELMLGRGLTFRITASRTEHDTTPDGHPRTRIHVDAEVVPDETKARVRTPAGARRFGQPIGSVIVADVRPGDVIRTTPNTPPREVAGVELGGPRARVRYADGGMGIIDPNRAVELVERNPDVAFARRLTELYAEHEWYDDVRERLPAAERTRLTQLTRDFSTWDLSSWQQRVAARDAGADWYARLQALADARPPGTPRRLLRGVTADPGWGEGDVVDLPLSDATEDAETATNYGDVTLIFEDTPAFNVRLIDADPAPISRFVTGGRFTIARRTERDGQVELVLRPAPAAKHLPGKHNQLDHAPGRRGVTRAAAAALVPKPDRDTPASRYVANARANPFFDSPRESQQDWIEINHDIMNASYDAWVKMPQDLTKREIRALPRERIDPLELVHTQPWLRDLTPELVPDDQFVHGHNSPILVARVGGVDFVTDGHHRIALAIAEQLDEVEVRVYDLDHPEGLPRRRGEKHLPGAHDQRLHGRRGAPGLSALAHARVGRGWQSRALGQRVITHTDEPTRARARTELRARLDDSRVFIRVPDHVIGDIVHDGRVRNQHETGWSGGMFNPNLRVAAEAALHDLPVDTPPARRPVYGYVSQDPHGIVVANWATEDSAGLLVQYGELALELKPEARERVTFTLGDSLDDSNVVPLDPATRDARIDQVIGESSVSYNRRALREVAEVTAHNQVSMAPAPLVDPTDADLDAALDGLLAMWIAPDEGTTLDELVEGRYAEAQIHDGVTLADLEAVHLPIGLLVPFADSDYEYDAADEDLRTLLDDALAAGLRVVLVGWSGEYDEDVLSQLLAAGYEHSP